MDLQIGCLNVRGIIPAVCEVDVDNMAVGHVVRSSGLLRLMLATLLLYSGILVTILKQPHTPLRLDDGFSAILPDNAVVARNCNFTSSRWVNRHIVSRLIVRKRFSSTRVNYYPNSVASYQISFLQLSGDVNPNPGPVCTEQRNSVECRRSTSHLRTFYANKTRIRDCWFTL